MEVEIKDKKKNIFVSVIMPVYNSEKYLAEAIESVLEQTYDYFELLLINDGSKDNSGNVCDEFAKKDSRIKVFHKQNGGVCNSRNLGISEAKGDYITFIDNDDLYDKDFLYKMVMALDDNLADMIKCGRRNISVNSEGKNVGSQDFSLNETSTYQHSDFIEQYYHLKATGVMGSVWNCLYRRSFILENNILFDESFKHGNEDIYFNIYCYLKCETMIILSDVLYKHFCRSSHSTSLQFHKEQVTTRIETFKLEENLIKPLIGTKWYNLIMMDNVRLCFKLLTIVQSKEERSKGIKLIEKELSLGQVFSYPIFRERSLSVIEKIELSLLKRKRYSLYFGLYDIARKSKR